MPYRGDYCIRKLLHRLMGCTVTNGLRLPCVDTGVVELGGWRLGLYAVYSTRRSRRPRRVVVCYGPLEWCEELADRVAATTLYVKSEGGRCPDGYEPYLCACRRSWG